MLDNDSPPRRVATYFDGCNLYNGLRTAKFRRYYWLDLVGLSRAFLRGNQTLVCTKYFTARILGNKHKAGRHSVYIDALTATGSIQVIEGNYQLEPYYCGNCKFQRTVPKEKQTDTNIATEMVADAFMGLWDTAFLVSGDSDLVPPIKCIRARFPDKSVVVAYPPSRPCRELHQAANTSFHINQTMLTNHQLPEEIQIGKVILRRPDYWK